MLEISIQEDSFASEHFGVKIGKLSPDSLALELAVVRNGLLKAQNSGIEVVTTRLSPHQVKEIDLVNSLRGKAFDVLITSTLYPTNQPETEFSPIKGIRIESYDKVVDEGDIAAIKRMGGTAFNLTHFYTDPRLSEEGWESFYGAWSVNDATKRAKQTVLARDLENGKVVGFTTLLAYDNEPTMYGIKTLGMVDLVAVSKDHRGWGVATRLVADSRKWLAKNTDVATVGTESVNYPAFAVYTKCGFRPTDIAYSYHLWLDEALK